MDAPSPSTGIDGHCQRLGRSGPDPAHRHAIIDRHDNGAGLGSWPGIVELHPFDDFGLAGAHMQQLSGRADLQQLLEARITPGDHRRSCLGIRIADDALDPGPVAAVFVLPRQTDIPVIACMLKSTRLYQSPES